MRPTTNLASKRLAFYTQSFLPIYIHEADYSRGEVFPEIWYLNHCQLTGIQYLELARILLVVYDPKIPHMGLGRRAAVQSVDQALIAIVLRICSIAASN